jgi:molybdate transport system ATP-binding protein
VSLDAEVRLHRGEFALDVALTAPTGSVTAVLGPNGAGKTTFLRAVAGLAAVEQGHIRVDGEVLDDPTRGVFVPPERRRVGVVFQDYLLFPHLGVLDNIAFGARASGCSAAEARRVAAGWMDRFDLPGRAAARPAQLSGGEAQRVALARALASDPRVLLLDEPLAALDATTRPQVRHDLRHHFDEFEGTTIVVTHDPVDALALADDIVIVEGGAVTQSGSLDEVTSRPRTSYVAQLLGTNLLFGEAHGHVVSVGDTHLTIAEPVEGPTLVTIAPSAVALHTREPEGSPRNHWPGRVESIEPTGDRARVRVRLPGNLDLVAEVTPDAVRDLGLQPGLEVWAAVKATEITTYER